MRFRAPAALRLAAVSAVLAAASTGCAVRARPYRFASPLLGQADVPPAWSGRNPAADPFGRNPTGRDPSGRDADDRHPVDPYADIRSADVRTSDRGHASGNRTDDSRAVVHVASARAADDVASASEARGIVWSRLPAPNRMPPEAYEPPLREVADLRGLVDRRDKRDSWAALFGWLHAGLATSRTGHELVAWASASTKTIGDVVEWARDHGQLEEPREAAAHDALAAGDLLVFDRTDGDMASDLVAIVVGRDARGVYEFMYVSGGAVRRGFVDPRRPAIRRDAAGAVVNTFMRTGKRWPPKGTHYLAGELLAQVVRLR
jgi:hypothetical protein